ncbi:hypothetical protein ACSIGC_11960 [Tenacibaculum sp. ZS6-P6]|uniref:hypothetical protein n=1 Tax=Tenacibaculum sp. ZS6-P6 TaxID=3447503 RepID=UPI003F9B981E
MKKLFFACITLICLNAFKLTSQNTFKKGYFVTNSNKRVECLIKDEGWQNNPKSFKYKQNNTENISTSDNAKEFGIYNHVTYIKSAVKIDRSSNKVNFLTEERFPQFKEEILYLKVLQKGKANLFQFQDGTLIRYFYNLNNTTPKQLVYKKYKIGSDKIRENQSYKQELFTKLKCKEITLKRVESIKYNESDLTAFFSEYNLCNGSKPEYKVKKEKTPGKFNVSVKAGASFSSLNIENNILPIKNVEFSSISNFRPGLEFEYILPINNNKWGLFLKTTYQTFTGKSEENSSQGIIVNTINTEIDYSSIEIPIGVKHYMYLNKKSKLFIGAGYLIDFPLDSKLNFSFESTLNGSVTSTSSGELNLEDSSTAFHLNFGYKYDKFSIEFEHYTNRNIMKNIPFWNSSSSTTAITLGYTLF